MPSNDAGRVSIFAVTLFLLVAACLLVPVGALIADSIANGAAGSGPSKTLVAPDPLSDTVAATAAEFRVDESGAATYSIPIYTVPGTAGVAPALAFSYSSQAGDGTLGKGWSIGGLSSISRCRATREAGDFIVNGVPTDGNPRPIVFTDPDRYCLDGQRLLRVEDGASACPVAGGMAGAPFRTEIESFQRVCAYANGDGAGPKFFTVERKDGSTSWYGDRDQNDTANRPDGYFNSTVPGKEAAALSWAQTRFQDSTGNYINFTYHKNANGVYGEHFLAEVQYTGKKAFPGQSGSDQAPYARIVFNYAKLPDARHGKGYLGGGLLTQAHQLHNVQVIADGQEARYYRLNYALSQAGSNRDTMTALQECRDSSMQLCLPATTFAWSDGRHEFATIERPADLTFATDHIRGFKTADINGDGRQDIALLYLAGSGCVGGTWVVTATSALTGTGVPTFQNSRFNCVPARIIDRGDGTWHLFDYDGDGRDDLFVSSATGQPWKVHPSDGVGFNMSINLISGLWPAIPSSNEKNDQVHLADLNGDGLMDIVYPSAGALRARIMERLGNGFGWAAERTVAVDMASLGPTPCDYDPLGEMECSRWISGVPTPKTQFAQLADFNGDAASDLLIQVTTHIEQRIWTGNCEVPSLPPIIESASVLGTTEDGAAVLPYRSDSETEAASLQGDLDCWRTETWTIDNLHAMVVKVLGSSSISVANYGALSSGDPAGLVLADANGDGLTDAFVRTRSHSDWSLAINRGNGFTFGPSFAFGNDRDLAQFVDVNGDGRADALHVGSHGSNKVFYVRHALPDGSYTASSLLSANARICEGGSCDPRKRSPMFMELDGDGQLDFLSLDYSSGNIKLYISRAGLRFQPRDAITKITNGLGAETDVAYAALTNKDVYRRDSGTRNSTHWGRGAPVMDFLAPIYVTARAASSSPQAGNAAAKATVHYRYANARVQAGGRGFLGFGTIETIDPNQSGGYVVTTTRYAQNFPFVGMPVQTSKRAIDGQSYAIPYCLSGVANDACFATPGIPHADLGGSLFSDSLQDWEAESEITGAATTGFTAGVQAPLHVRTTGSVETLRDPYSGVSTSKVVTAFNYGTYGNTLQTAVDTYTGSAELTSTVITSNAYAADDPARWRLGRLTSSTVSHQRPGRAPIQRTSGFSYAMSGAVTGLLTEERIQPGGSISQDLRKVYSLDDYGNRTASTTCSAQVASCTPASISFRPSDQYLIHRYSRVAYDSRGRYPVNTYEPFWNGSSASEAITQTVVARNLFGDVVQAYDVNGLDTLAVTGSFGRPYYAWAETVPGSVPGSAGGGVSTTTTYRWCGAGGSAVDCPAGARFREKAMASGAPTQWTYYDVLGRPIMKAAETLNIGVSGKDVSAVCTAYDATGKPKQVSNPFFIAGTGGSDGPTGLAAVCGYGRDWTTTVYDVLGRPRYMVSPDNSTVSTSYSGNQTTVVDQRNNATQQIRNGAGELVQTIDAGGLTVTYWYLADGSNYLVSRNAGRGPVENGFVYDDLGRKTLQGDPDSGLTHFAYNALGELIAQVDAEDNRVEHAYDARGRVWQRTVRLADGSIESQSQFVFDTATNGLGQPASEAITGTYSVWRGFTDLALQSSRGYSYDALGRPLASTTVIDGASYPSALAYDPLGRPFRAQDASGRWAKTEFNARGYPHALCTSSANDLGTECDNAQVWQRTQETNAWGQTTRELRSEALPVTRTYSPLTGRLERICADKPGGGECDLVDEQYAWDAAGNLHTRYKDGRYLEGFSYDGLNRLTLGHFLTLQGTNYTWQTAPNSHWGDYDQLGNVCGGNGKHYTYEGRAGCGAGGNNSIHGGGGTGLVGAHRVSSAGGSFYYYDGRGNQTFRDAPGTADDRTIRYSADDKPYVVRTAERVARFWYGADGQRYKRVDVASNKRTLYLGNVEIEIQGSLTTYKRTLGGGLLQTSSNRVKPIDHYYLFHDQLGSLVKTTDAQGNETNSLDYIPVGGRRSIGNPQQTIDGSPSLTNRGFTGHEHLDGLDAIHMNGRLYDPVLARFLQPDPVIQAPGNTQSWNAYTYVFNNPLAYTDPTGMISLRQVLGIAIIVVAAITQQYWAISAATKFWGTVAVGALAGGVSTGTWQGALWGAFSAAAFYGVGEAFSGVTGAEGTGVFGSGLSSGAYGAKVLAHGVTGGVMSKLQGGKFGHGFASAGVTQAFAPGIDRIGGGASRYAGARVAAAAVLGGTASKLSGGKFANGAVTAAFSRAFNGEFHRRGLNTSEDGEEAHAFHRADEESVFWPTDNGTINSQFGMRVHPDTGILQLHNGLDIRARLGASIYSTQSGIVLDINSSFSGGNQILIRNNNGSISGYAHTSAIKGLRVGDSVSGGRKIGFSDASGWARNKAHLHYTYRPPTYNGLLSSLSTPAYNPMIQLRNAYRPPEGP